MVHKTVILCCSALIDSSLLHVTLLTTGKADRHLTSLTGSGPHVSAGPTIILVVIRSRVGTVNRQESCGVIKGLSLASLDSLAPCWRRAYTELMGFGRGVREGGRGEGGRCETNRLCMCVSRPRFRLTCADCFLTDD